MRHYLLGVMCLAGFVIACTGLVAPDAADAARDAHQTALRACNLYELAPASAHTPEADEVCAQLRRVCAEPATSTLELEAPPPAYGNKIVGL